MTIIYELRCREIADILAVDLTHRQISFEALAWLFHLKSRILDDKIRQIEILKDLVSLQHEAIIEAIRVLKIDVPLSARITSVLTTLEKTIPASGEMWDSFTNVENTEIPEGQKRQKDKT